MVSLKTINIMLEYSVALATFNGSKYITEQLISIINQTVPPSEIVISDDLSSDDTIVIAETILCKSGINYKIIINKGTHGVSYNFYNAISHTTYPIVFTSDQDDLWIENKAELMLKVYDLYPKAMLVFSDGELVNSKLESLNSSLWESVGISKRKLTERKWFNYMLKKCMITGSAMCFRRELINKMPMIPKEWLHDGWIAWYAVAQKGLFPCNYKLFKYRQHEENVVGMRPRGSLSARLNVWINNMKFIQSTREIRKYRYESLLSIMGECFSESEKMKLKECVSFWDTLCNLPISRIKKLGVITRLLLNGDYFKYYTGLRGYIRDVVLVFVA